MKVFISAKWELKETVRELYQQFIAMGDEVAEDWTQHPAVRPYDADIPCSARNAQLDAEGMLRSDLFILLTGGRGPGSNLELGIAIGSNMLRSFPVIYVVGRETNQSQHYFNPVVNHRSRIEDVLADREAIQAYISSLSEQ